MLLCGGSCNMFIVLCLSCYLYLWGLIDCRMSGSIVRNVWCTQTKLHLRCFHHSVVASLRLLFTCHLDGRSYFEAVYERIVKRVTAAERNFTLVSCVSERECLSRILHKNCFQCEVLGPNSSVAEGILRHIDWSIVNDVSKWQCLVVVREGVSVLGLLAYSSVSNVWCLYDTVIFVEETFG